jgi:hypothetical protein
MPVVLYFTNLYGDTFKNLQDLPITLTAINSLVIHFLLPLQLENLAFVPLHKVISGIEVINRNGIAPQDNGLATKHITTNEGIPMNTQLEIRTHQGIFPPAKDLNALPSS